MKSAPEEETHREMPLAEEFVAAEVRSVTPIPHRSVSWLAQGSLRRAPLAFFAAARRVPWAKVTFSLFVVLPSFLTIVYFAAVAAPQFVVETRMVVRAAEPGDSPASPSAAAGTFLSYSPTAQHAYIVAHYIRSRGVVDDLLTRLDLREIYRRPEADFWARLPQDATMEELTDYWLKMTRAYVDAPSGIIIVEVKAFRPEDALQLAQVVTSLSENLVNQISQHAREDVMRSSEEEVKRADLRMREALQDLQVARNAESTLDPVKAADETGKLLLPLMAEKIRLESELYVATRTLEKTAPSVKQFISRIEVIDSQINQLRASMAGDSSSSRNVASSLRRFEALETMRLLAEKALNFSEDGLERARIRAERQNLYLMIFVPPSLPTKAEFPRRVAYSVLLTATFLIVWSIFALMFASIEDHRS